MQNFKDLAICRGDSLILSDDTMRGVIEITNVRNTAQFRRIKWYRYKLFMGVKFDMVVRTDKDRKKSDG